MFDVPLQTVSLPVMLPANEGTELTVIANLLSAPSPQSLCPFTFNSPDIALFSKFTEIILVVLVPDIPVGKVQI